MIGRWIDGRRLPRPGLILHTHVQPEHCREADQFPGADILVHEELAELAGDPAAYEKAAHTVWENPADWMNSLGREKYGIAGSITALPPEVPLKVAGTFREGGRLTWQDLVFEVIPLPGHGRHHVGFVLEVEGRPLAIFTGDVLCHPAKLVDIYDLECNYGGTAIASLPAVLRALAQRPVRRYFPSTGPVLEDGPDQALELAGAIDAYQEALEWHSGDFEPSPHTESPRVGRYLQLHRGVYQIDNSGNCILLIDEQGHGLMFDPGPCDFESPNRLADFHRDLDLFELECGLKTIDLTLVTHIHGDHYDCAPALRERYPGCRIAAWDLVARVIEAPRDYPYPALLPWYGLGLESVAVDDILTEDAPYLWRDTPIAAMHLPGHCYCHAGYLLTFNGLRLAITGDTIQSRGASDTLDFIVANHSVPDAVAGQLKSFRALLERDIDMNVGGHGSHFRNCRGMYEESVRRIEHVIPHLRRLVPDGDLHAAFLRPGMPRFGGSTRNGDLGDS
jgi:glyoxylase-like metal-dependent hydrolase (beta-lactamase superfamily II)